MTNRRLISVTLAAVLLSGAAAPAHAQWVFLARKAVGRVEQLTEPPHSGQPGYDVATVILDANADRVYETVLDHVRQRSDLTIKRADGQERTLSVSDGMRNVGFQVNPLQDNVSQLVIASAVSQDDPRTTSVVVDAVLRVCEQMRVECHRGKE